MGNGLGLGGKKTTKVMKIDGETMKLRTPVRASEVLKEHPGLVLLESEEVKHYGIRAKPLEGNKELMAKRLYFLVELPKEAVVPRRVRSGINMSAKDRLESLVLARRSASDLTIMNKGSVRLKMRLPRGEVERVMSGCQTQAQASDNIIGLCMANAASNNIMGLSHSTHRPRAASASGESTKVCFMLKTVKCMT
ncbi:hypothetical protein VNO78_09635 [Psophocarpus tetragonolobus]|uniref:Plastid movement impaired protein n=1 Tax=Psophocarpus tetragonolobus TaxID=3891 RepID=A0AAN9SWE9_PSOTE